MASNLTAVASNSKGSLLHNLTCLSRLLLCRVMSLNDTGNRCWGSFSLSGGRITRHKMRFIDLKSIMVRTPDRTLRPLTRRLGKAFSRGGGVVDRRPKSLSVIPSKSQECIETEGDQGRPAPGPLKHGMAVHGMAWRDKQVDCFFGEVKELRHCE